MATPSPAKRRLTRSAAAPISQLMDPLPSPFERLAGCMWLPRILAKARLFAADALPEDYAKRFCAVTGVDAEFLKHFGLAREDILELARLSDADAAARFAERPSCGAARIDAWNRIAPSLGKPGFPLADRFPIAMKTIYTAHLDKGIDNIFDALVEDERATQAR